MSDLAELVTLNQTSDGVPPVAKLERELRRIAKSEYSTDFSKDSEMRMQFTVDVLKALDRVTAVPKKSKVYIA